tara:strand:- start:389 stop:940 length:552 start_codon:yes stop_codon:yes gene_type:complete
VDYKDKLRNKKLKLKLEYLRLELEETQMTFHDSLVLFQNDFTEYLDEWENPKNVKKVDSEIEFDIPKEKVNKVFKKIATKTHPDKLINQSDDSDRLVELYKEAQQSVEKKDWSRVSQIASELDIDISDVEEDDSVFLERTIKDIESKVDEIKQTFAWLWRHTDKKSKPQLKKHILNVMGVKEK